MTKRASGEAPNLAIDRPMGKGRVARRIPVERTMFARKLLVKDFKPYNEVVAAIIGQFGVAESTAQGDIQSVREELREEQLLARPQTLQWAMDNAVSLFTAAQANDDWKAALDALNSIVKWTGAGSPDRIEHTILSDDDVEEELAYLRGAAISEAETADLVSELEKRGVRVYQDAEVIE